jgi:hypothetical protein
MAKCGARTRSCRNCGHRYTKGEYGLWECPECGEPRGCQQPVQREGERCRFHGGASPKGIASPNFKTGRHSRYLPAKLLSRYKEALSDPDLLELRSEIALVDARIKHLLDSVEAGESGALWRKASKAYEELQEAQAKRDPAAAAAAYKALGDVIRQGVGEWATWDEVGKQIDRRRQLVESERRRLEAMQQMITAERAMILLSAVTDIIRKNVTDKDTLRSISDDIRALLDRGTGQPNRA